MILKNLKIRGEAVKILSMKEAGIDMDIVEDGASFEENAATRRQGRWPAKRKALWCLPTIPVLRSII